MRIFITGGAGFIGSHLVDSYLAEGHEVSILDNLSTGSMENIKHVRDQIEIHQGDIRNTDLVNRLVAKSDVVLHMAAALGVHTILESTVESISTNFAGSEVVLNSALKNDKRILIASTSEIYGKNPKQPLSETDDRVIGAPQKIRWSYSDAKALEEALAQSLFNEKDLQVTTIRFFNTVGPRQSGRYGMVVPRFVTSALNHKVLQVYGNGNQTRVFCHISDVVNAISLILKDKKSVGEVFNIGGLNEISINDLANKVIAETNSKSTIEHVSFDKAYAKGFEDMQRRVPDITKISKFFGWKPTRNLSDIIQDVAKYHAS